MALKPSSVLDIGSGFGKYGVLCREYLDLWDGRQKYEFDRRIDGVEVFNKYITPLHQFIYNNLYNEDITKIVDRLEIRYDLVLFIDVLEHFEKHIGHSLLERLLAKNKGIIIGTPKQPSPQKDAFGNIYETHKSSWSREDFLKMGKCFFIPDNISLIVYITRDINSLIELQKRIRILKKARGGPRKTLKTIITSIPGARIIYKQIKKFSM